MPFWFLDIGDNGRQAVPRIPKFISFDWCNHSLPDRVSGCISPDLPFKYIYQIDSRIDNLPGIHIAYVFAVDCAVTNCDHIAQDGAKIPV